MIMESLILSFLVFGSYFDVMKKRMISNLLFYLFAVLSSAVHIILGSFNFIHLAVLVAVFVVVSYIKDSNSFGHADTMAIGVMFYSIPNVIVFMVWLSVSTISMLLFHLVNATYDRKFRPFKNKLYPFFPFMLLGFILTLLNLPNS